MDHIDGVQYLEHMHTFILSIYSIFTLSIVAAPCSKAIGPGKMEIRPT
jgi:L-aminopeptidase/D-esterase-like protein